MRVPGRLHISWNDDITLKIETDAGTQTRPFHFAADPQVAAFCSGECMARLFGGVLGGSADRPPRAALAWGFRARGFEFALLEVVTTNFATGYFRKNGVPYSDKTT